MFRRGRPLRIATCAAAALALLSACRIAGRRKFTELFTGCSTHRCGFGRTGIGSIIGCFQRSRRTRSRPAPAPAGLVIYNAQHEDLTQAWAEEFTKETGIKVEMRNGSDNELANQLVAGGLRRPRPTSSSPRTRPA